MFQHWLKHLRLGLFCGSLFLLLVAISVNGQIIGNEPIQATQGSYLHYLPLIAKPFRLSDLISVRTISLPIPLEGTAHSWCTNTGCNIGPRLYHAPLPNDSDLIGWSDGQGTGYITQVVGQNVQHWPFPGRSIRGLVAHADYTFAVLLWDEAADTIYLSKRHADGSEIWTTSLNSDIAAADFWLGDGRLDYGGGLYAAYFTVKGNAGGFNGHHGDQLSYVNDFGVIQNDGWNWGCSHSMAQLVSYHPQLDQFAAICSSDCFPDKSIHWVNASHQIFQTAGNCGGLVSAQLGQMAVAEQSWKLVFNAINEPCCASQGVAFATLTAEHESSYVWLTNSNGAYERDPVLARLGNDLSHGRYLTGWMTSNDNGYWLGIINDAGDFLMGPENVAATAVFWGNRDNSLQTRANGDVSWVAGHPNSNQIQLFRFDAQSLMP